MSDVVQCDDVIFKAKKKYLKGYLKIVKRIERLENKLFEIDSQLYSIRGQIITDMPRGGTPTQIEDVLARKDETNDRINQLLQESWVIRKDICKVLDTLEDVRHVEILELFFINGLSIEEIADQCGYNIRHTTRLYSEGIRLLVIDGIGIAST